MKTDGDILLELLGESCCCECECERARARGGVRAPTLPNEAAPARPQMFGKKALPLTVIDLETPFVPPLYPERESPQLPQPLHLPYMAPNFPGRPAEMQGGALPGSEPGFTTGIMLDDGTLNLLDYRQIDHQTRTFRAFKGDEFTHLEYNTTEPLTKYSQQEIAAALEQDPPAGDLSQTQETIAISNDVSYSVTAAGWERFKDSLTLALPVLGLMLQTTAPVATLGPSQVIPYTVSAQYSERPGGTFEGAMLPVEPIIEQLAGIVTAYPYRSKVLVNTGETIVGPYRKDGDPITEYYSFTAHRHELTPVGDLYNIEVGWFDENFNHQSEAFTVSTSLPPGPLTFERLNSEGLGKFSISPVLGCYRVAFAVSLFGLPYGTTSISPGQPLDTGKTRWRGVYDADYILGRAVPKLWSTLDTSDAPDLELPAPVFTFRSPVVEGRSFEFRLPPGSDTNTDFTDLQGQDVLVNGASLGTTWRHWSAYRDKSGLTLLLDDGSSVMIVPGLDTDKTVRVSWSELLADLRHPSAYSPGLCTHPGFHSFPGDRAYCAIGGEGNVSHLAFGPWDAYRDVPADEWRALKLSKPRTRKAFEQYRAADKPLPPRPAHGLALWDVYAVQRGQDS